MVTQGMQELADTIIKFLEEWPLSIYQFFGVLLLVVRRVYQEDESR